MTQNTNDENDNGFTWARNPGSSSESSDAATTPDPAAAPAAAATPDSVAAANPGPAPVSPATQAPPTAAAEPPAPPATPAPTPNTWQTGATTDDARATQSGGDSTTPLPAAYPPPASHPQTGQSPQAPQSPAYPAPEPNLFRPSDPTREQPAQAPQAGPTQPGPAWAGQQAQPPAGWGGQPAQTPGQSPWVADVTGPAGPHDQSGQQAPTGQYNPAGQYPTGQYDQSAQYNPAGPNDQSGQYNPAGRPDQSGQYAQAGQYAAVGASGAGYGSGGPPSGGGVQPYASASGGLPPENGASKARRQPRRPGWAGVIAVGVGAAALASLLTAGIVSQNDDSNSSTVVAAVSGPVVKAPVSGSNVSAPDWGAVAKAVEPSVVAVKVTGSSGSGEGSGVILDQTGRIVTNNHVVSGVGSGATVTVVLADGRTYPASVVGTDSSTDLAVIKLTSSPGNLTPAVFGSSSSVSVGDPVMAVGNPLGLAGTVTTGIVSATDRPTTTQAESTDPNSTTSSDPVVTNAIQTDAAVNPGNSGGALVDSQGRVIGIPSSIASLSDGSPLGGQSSSQSGSIGLGFAIPIDEVKDVTSQLIKGGTVAHSWLGVSVAAGSVKFGSATQDAAVLKSIVSGSPAERAGLKAGDAVIAVNGRTVNSDLSLVGLLREEPVNTVVTLSVVRDGKTSNVKVTLGTKPASAS